MISALSNIGGLGNVNAVQQLQGVSQSIALGTSASGQAGKGITQNTANISGPGQLLSNLQQLQTQNPALFQQVVSKIASQLETAAQQTQGTQSANLSNLTTLFQNVASGGNLSQLQPHQPHHHHHAQQSYSQNSQSQPLGLSGLAQMSGTQSTGSSSVQQLFSTISTEVSQALGH